MSGEFDLPTLKAIAATHGEQLGALERAVADLKAAQDEWEADSFADNSPAAAKFDTALKAVTRLSKTLEALESDAGVDDPGIDLTGLAGFGERDQP